MKTAILAVLLASSAFAQTERDEKPSTKVDFTETPIDGTIVKPISTYIPVKRPTIFPNLIKIRGSFAPELQKSTDQL